MSLRWIMSNWKRRDCSFTSSSTTPVILGSFQSTGSQMSVRTSKSNLNTSGNKEKFLKTKLKLLSPAVKNNWDGKFALNLISKRLTVWKSGKKGPKNMLTPWFVFKVSRMSSSTLHQRTQLHPKDSEYSWILSPTPMLSIISSELRISTCITSIEMSTSLFLVRCLFSQSKS